MIEKRNKQREEKMDEEAMKQKIAEIEAKLTVLSGLIGKEQQERSNADALMEIRISRLTDTLRKEVIPLKYRNAITGEPFCPKTLAEQVQQRLAIAVFSSGGTESSYELTIPPGKEALDTAKERLTRAIEENIEEIKKKWPDFKPLDENAGKE